VRWRRETIVVVGARERQLARRHRQSDGTRATTLRSIPRPRRCPHPSSTTKFDYDGAAGCHIGLRDASRYCSRQL